MRFDRYSRYLSLLGSRLRLWLYVIIKHQGVLSSFRSASETPSSFCASSTQLWLFLKSGGSFEGPQPAVPFQLIFKKFHTVTEECFDGVWQYVSCFLCLFLLLLSWFGLVLRQCLSVQPWMAWNLLCGPGWLSPCFLNDSHKHC